MTRRITAGLGLALAFVLLAPLPGEAQDFRVWRRPVPPAAGLPVQQGAPNLRRANPRLPNYYFDRSGPVAAPKGPVGQGDIASSLRARGFRDIGPMQQRGSTSITEAVGPAGERVQLVIGPNGNIVGVRVLNQGRP
jgi:hypothetical protein